MTRIVWGLGTPRTFRPLWALAELALEYEHRKILSRGPGMEDEHFRTLSRLYNIGLPTALAAYHQRVASRPAFDAAMTRNHPSNAKPGT